MTQQQIGYLNALSNIKNAETNAAQATTAYDNMLINRYNAETNRRAQRTNTASTWTSLGTSSLASIGGAILLSLL